MAEEYFMDKTLDTGNTYTTTSRDYYIIREVGYDADAKQDLTVDGKKCLEVSQMLTPLATTFDTSNFGLGDLRDLFIVIPPETDFELGGSGQLLRIRGVHGQLAPNESLPSRYDSRYKNQFDHYWKCLTLVKSVDLSSAGEYTIEAITPLTKEEYRLNHRVTKIDATPQATTWNMAWVRFYVENNPIIAYTANNDHWGWDIWTFPEDGETGTNSKPRFMKGREQILEGDKEFELRVYSDGDPTAAAGNVGLKFWAEYKSPTFF